MSVIQKLLSVTEVFFYQNYNNKKVLRQQTFSHDFCAENALSPNKKGPPGGAFGKGVVIEA